jgi:hypothetical protein
LARHYRNRGAPPVGRSQAPRCPCVAWHLRCPPCCPPLPLKKEPLAAADFLLPRTSFVSPVHARALRTLSAPPRRLPHRFSTTGAPPPRQTLSERRRRPPNSGERPSELLHPLIDCRLLTPESPSSYRTHPPSLTTTRATPSPLNTAARHRLRHLAVGPPLRCAPAHSSLPGTSPVPPRDLRQHLAAVKPPVRAPLRRPARGDHVGTRAARVRCRVPRGPFSPLCRAARPWPRGCFGRHAPWAVASGRFSAQYSTQGFKCFSIVLNSRNCLKLQKCVETCRNV